MKKITTFKYFVMLILESLFIVIRQRSINEHINKTHYFFLVILLGIILYKCIIYMSVHPRRSTDPGLGLGGILQTCG